MKDFLSQAGNFLKKQKLYRRQLAVFLCLAVMVAFGTVAALKLYGQAMTHKTEVLDCSYEVHEHTEECYGVNEEGEPERELVCGYADYVVHVHNDGCYDKEGNLVCALEEHKPHEHTEECYVTEKVLVCGEKADGDDASVAATGEEVQGNAEASVEGEMNLEESTGEASGTAPGADIAEISDKTEEPAADLENNTEPEQPEIVCEKEVHMHNENCYENVQICGYAEEHTHSVECISHELVCTTAEHVHSDECYDADGNIICGMEEHMHEIGCYDEDGNTLCNMENHVHDENCLNAEGKIACGLEGHEHITGCYKNFYGCGKEEHVHSESCYAQNLICEKEEHEHVDTCFAKTDESEESEADINFAAESEESEVGTEPAESGTDTEESGAISEGSGGESGPAGESASAEINPQGHIHTDACYQEVTRLICGEQELHTHDDSCYDEECFDEEGNKASFNVIVIYESTSVKHHEDGSAYTIEETDWSELLDTGNTESTGTPKETESGQDAGNTPAGSEGGDTTEGGDAS